CFDTRWKRGETRGRARRGIDYPWGPTRSERSRNDMKPWLALSAAIVSEVIATSALKASAGFTKPGPVVLVVLGYAAAFYFLALTLRAIPVGVAYAVWSGVGIVLICLIGWLLFGQRLDAPALIGIGLIIAGVVVLNAFSKTVTV